ncbi:hypothetical protein ACIRPX_41860 [Streptomyces sp. NPDC101225]|uniref:hypothetical protein n=1 Tax=Streptomyces sp. NPDC101225 TaxID=3366135 RepID=UPI003801ADA8
MPVTHPHAAHSTPQPAVLGRELTLAAHTDDESARALARTLAGHLSPRARLILLGALADTGRALLADGGWGTAPAGVVRVRFADGPALARAAAAFAAGPVAGCGDAVSDPAELTLHIPADTGVECLRAVLTRLDAAAAAARSLTVHGHELDDVLASFTGPP